MQKQDACLVYSQHFIQLWLYALSLGLILLIPTSAAAQANSNTLQAADDLLEQGKYAESIPLYESFIKENTTENADLATAHSHLGRAYTYTGKFPEAKHNYKLGFELAEKFDVGMIKFQAGDALHLFYKMSGKLDSAYYYMDVCREATFELEMSNEYAYTLSALGSIHLVRREYEKAQRALEHALTIKDSIGSTEGVDLIKTSLADLHKVRGEYQLAADYVLQALEARRARNDSTAIISDLGKLSQILLLQKDIEKAKLYALEGLEIAKLKEFETFTGSIVRVLGQIAEVEKDYDKAIEYFQQAFEIFFPRNKPPQASWVARDLARVYLSLNQTANAKPQIDLTIQKAKEFGDTQSELDGILLLGHYYLKVGQTNKGKEIARELLMRSQEDEFLRIRISTYDLYADLYQKSGQYKEANEMLKTFHKLQDSVFTLSKDKAVQELELRYNKAADEKEIADLKIAQTESALDLEKANRQRLLFAFGLLLTFLLAGAMGYILYINRRNNKQLSEKNEVISEALSEKELLLKEIHHRVKNNLQIVSSLLGLQEHSIKDEKVAEAIKDGQSRVNSMALIHQNLYQEDNLIGVEVEGYIERLVDNLFHTYHLSTDISLKKEIDPLMLDVDTIIPIGLIINELLINAMKYAFPPGKQGEILVKLKEESEGLLLVVEDNGQGAAANMEAKGTSFGMRLIRSLAKKLKADLDVQQEKGTRVSLLIHNYQLAS